MLVHFAQWAARTLSSLDLFWGLLAVVSLLALVFHFWSTRQTKRLQREWNEERALHLQQTWLRWLFSWLALCWVLVGVGLYKWLR